MSKKHIIIVDDHQLFRNGLKFIISEFEDMEVVGEASNGVELLEILKVVSPDIILMDIRMPEMDGIEASEKALKTNPNLKILVLSMFGDEQYYNTMIDIGVKGFVLKDADNNELKNAIYNILKGGNYFSQELLLKLIKNKTQENILLTRREKEVLKLICKGQSNSQISQELFISQRTVERHRANLLQKTESKNSISLVVFAIKNNLVEI